MIGVNATTGKRLDGLEHLRQSVADILTTPIGTRVGRRDYGSLLFELIDKPMNGTGRMRVIAAIAAALRRWEPRLRITRIQIAGSDPAAMAAGRFTLDLEATRTDVPAPNTLARLSIPLTFRPATA